MKRGRRSSLIMKITDDSGNEYTVVSNGASGNNEYVSAARVIAKNLDEE